MHHLLNYHKNWWNKQTNCSLWFYSKIEATNFNAVTLDTNNFKSFMYKAKLLENTETDGASGILKSALLLKT